MVKKIILIAAVLFVFQHCHTIMAFINPPPDYAAAHDGKVILYSTSWCGYCKQARELLEENHIAYYEYDIENSAEGAEQHKNLGGRGIPVLLVNGTVVKGYSPDKILSLAGK